MSTSSQKSVINKPLSVDFDLHTDGDEEFKNELIVLMIDNVKELHESLNKSVKVNNMDAFKEACHKVKPTISILNDKDLVDTIELLKNPIEDAKKADAIVLFNSLCEYLIKGLEEELK